MPWKVRDAMSERLDLVTLAGQPGANMAELCRWFGVSRKTGYKWLNRFAALGAEGLLDRSRRPKVSPRRTLAAVEAAALALRRANPAVLRSRVGVGGRFAYRCPGELPRNRSRRRARSPAFCAAAGCWSGRRRCPSRSKGSKPKPPTTCGRWISKATLRSPEWALGANRRHGRALLSPDRAGP